MCDETCIRADPNVWSGRVSQEVFSIRRLTVLHQCIRPHMRALASSYFISTLVGFCHFSAVDLIDQGGAPINTGLPCKPHIRRD
jgi:hypothetical protein